MMQTAEQKNEDMAAHLLGGAAVAGMRRRFSSFKVDVRLVEDRPSPNALFACLVALNLLPRTLKHVRYGGPRHVLKKFPPSHRRRLKEGRWDADATVVFGRRKVAGARNALYAGSSGWSSYLSVDGPCPWVPAVPNALGAMHAGALAAGEVFKMLVPGAEPELATTLEYDLLTHGRAKQPVVAPPSPGSLDLGDLAVVGCGAIGQALCYALAASARLEGRITLIDGDRLDKSNEQRYMGAFKETRGAPKTRQAGRILTSCSPMLQVNIAPMEYEAYAERRNVRFQEAVVCVDNEWTRVNVQGGLPRTLWNGWTDVGRNSLRYGASRHSLSGDSACLACYYRPSRSPSGEEMDALRTGLGRDRIREMRESGEPCSRDLLDEVSRKRKIPRPHLGRFDGKPLEDLLHGDCGVYYTRPGEPGAPTPAPHQPALAGILLASQLVLERIAPGAAGLGSLSEFDALRLPGSLCLFGWERHPGCFCGDPAYRRAYRRRWG